MTSKDLLNRESGSALKEQLSFIGAMATLGAGFAGSVVLLATALAKATPESVCGRGYRRQTQPQRKSVDSGGTVYTFSKVYPAARQPLAPGALCRQSDLNRGREFARPRRRLQLVRR
jgi:hypothetical protein